MIDMRENARMGVFSHFPFRFPSKKSAPIDPSPKTLENQSENAIATIQAEISELDTIGFDETLELDVSVDISYIIDS
jgi:hypothetical protein